MPGLNGLDVQEAQPGVEATCSLRNALLAPSPFPRRAGSILAQGLLSPAALLLWAVR
jgi:hypothetical protein